MSLAFALEELSSAPASLELDPLAFPRRWSRPADQEVMAVLAASLAFGRVRGFWPVLEALHVLAERHGGPEAWLRGFDGERGAELLGLQHRWVRGADLALGRCRWAGRGWWTARWCCRPGPAGSARRSRAGKAQRECPDQSRCAANLAGSAAGPGPRRRALWRCPTRRKPRPAARPGSSTRPLPRPRRAPRPGSARAAAAFGGHRAPLSLPGCRRSRANLPVPPGLPGRRRARSRAGRRGPRPSAESPCEP